ncbi:hypothetical protein [Delftia acidovorans]|uniref:hypothetical protein n=1 Tax=Delftia acidovorans TaxID=80866 RepID=UPI00301A51E3
MADSNSLTPLDLARAAVTQTEASYELALELQTLLDGLAQKDDSSSVSLLIFPLQRMANRACLAADLAYVAALRARDALGAA